MTRRLLNWIAFSLQPLAILSVCLLVAPVLYPAIMLIAGLIAFLAVLLVLFYPRRGLHAPADDAPAPRELDEGPSRFSREFLKAHGGTRRAMRSLKMSLFALLMSVVLYHTGVAHSNCFYVNSLSRELSPLRENFRRELRTDAPQPAANDATSEPTTPIEPRSPNP
jgi:dolichol kinase